MAIHLKLTKWLVQHHGEPDTVKILARSIKVDDKVHLIIAFSHFSGRCTLNPTYKRQSALSNASFKVLDIKNLVEPKAVLIKFVTC